jgi:hypothetical protein
MNTRPMNTRMMNTRMVLLAFPLIALAQSSPPSPPAEVDAALRARANQFFQYYVDGNFRKAYDMVAEDTKDAYFNGTKNRLKNFQLGNIKYSDNFTRAEVTLNANREVFVMGHSVPMTISIPTTFKIEDGKWVWYEVPIKEVIEPTGLYQPNPAKPGANASASGLPTDLSPEALRSAAVKLLGQTGVDKSVVVVAADKASDAKVVFHNGLGGTVQVRLVVLGDNPGFTAKLEKTLVNPGEDSNLLVHYDPPGTPQLLLPVTLRLMVSPTAQTLDVAVKFAMPATAH